MPVEIIMSGGFVVLVDAADYFLVSGYKWRASQPNSGTPYAMTDGDDNHTLLMHRFIMDAPKGMDVDHIDGNRLNNQRSNLRIVTRRENCRNRNQVLADKKNKWGFHGVCRPNGNGRLYYGRLAIDGRQIYTKGYETPIEAARAWDDLAIRHYGRAAKLNFPREQTLEELSVANLTDALRKEEKQSAIYRLALSQISMMTGDAGAIARAVLHPAASEAA